MEICMNANPKFLSADAHVDAAAVAPTPEFVRDEVAAAAPSSRPTSTTRRASR
jgi:phosphomethylpyrimidine synthase